VILTELINRDLLFNIWYIFKYNNKQENAEWFFLKKRDNWCLCIIPDIMGPINYLYAIFRNENADNGVIFN